VLWKPLKAKGSGAVARAEGPFLKWQNRSGKAAKALGERGDFGRGVGLGDPQRSLPTPNILWFCD